MPYLSKVEHPARNSVVSIGWLTDLCHMLAYLDHQSAAKRELSVHAFGPTYKFTPMGCVELERVWYI